MVAQLRADLLRAEQAAQRMQQAKRDIQQQLQAMAGCVQSIVFCSTFLFHVDGCVLCVRGEVILCDAGFHDAWRRALAVLLVASTQNAQPGGAASCVRVQGARQHRARQGAAAVGEGGA